MKLIKWLKNELQTKKDISEEIKKAVSKNCGEDAQKKPHANDNERWLETVVQKEVKRVYYDMF